MNKVTIIDVAEEAGVSPATVSRVINDTAKVSVDKKNKVKKAVKKLDYKPNKFARALRKQKSNTIGIVVPDISNPYFADLVRGIEIYLNEKGFVGIIGDSNSKQGKEGEYISTLLREQVDGVIVISSGEGGQQLYNIIERDICLVAADRDLPLEGISKVLVNNKKGGVLACKHLIDQNYKHLGFIKGPEEISTAKERYDGFMKMLKESEVEFESEFIMQGDYTFEGGRIATNELLGGLDDSKLPFGLVASDDLMALGAMRAADNCGLEIPEEFGVVGFDNILMGKLMNPPLTTVSIPSKRIGTESAQILVKNIKRKVDGLDPVITKKVFDVNLVKRESSLLNGKK